MNFIKNRLKRLENERRNRCPECGLPPGGPGRPGRCAPSSTRTKRGRGDTYWLNALA